MRDRVSETAVFEEVDPDPDAVIEAYGADTPADLVAGSGDHDPVWEGFDTDAEAVADVVGDLTDETLQPPTDDGDPPTEPEPASAEAKAVDAIDEAVFASEPATTVVEGDGDRIDRIVGDRDDRDRFASDDRDRCDRDRRDSDRRDHVSTEVDGFALIGPDPDPVRIASDTSEST